MWDKILIYIGLASIDSLYIIGQLKIDNFDQR